MITRRPLDSLPVPRRVLLAEDTLEIHEGIADNLRDEGFGVDVASSGAEALKGPTHRRSRCSR